MGRDVVRKNLFQNLLAGLVVVFGNSLERAVSGSEDSEVGFSAVQSLDEVWEFIDKLGKLGSVVAFRDKLVDGKIGLVVGSTSVRGTMVRTIMRAVVRWLVMVRLLVGWLLVVVVVVLLEEREWVDAVVVVHCRIEPALSIKVGFVHLVTDIVPDLGGECHSIIERVLRFVGDAIESAGNLVRNVVVSLAELIHQIGLGWQPDERRGLLLTLNGNVGNYLLVRNDKGRAECSKLQENRGLHYNRRWVGC